MADLTQEKRYKFIWNNSKFKDLAYLGSPLSDFVNDVGYITSAQVSVSGSSFTGSFTGSFFGLLVGTASYATTAATASYFSGSISNAIFAQTASYVEGLGPYNLIYDGTVSASVATTGNIFLIKSASIELFKVDNGGTTTFSNNSGLTVLKVSQSGQVNFLTQSFNPTGPAPLGGFWFTSHSLYIGLE